MNTELRNRCDLLVENRDAIKEAYKWNDSAMLLAAGSLFTGLNKNVSVDRLKVCEKILKDKTGLLSTYRGNVKMPVLCKMTLADDPEAYLENLMETEKMMKQLKWIDHEYKVMAALTLCDHAKKEDIPAYIDQMAALYQGMKENHPYLTSGEDLPFAAMLAVSGMDYNALITEMEKCYKYLGMRFHDKNACQSLSHVLSLDPADHVSKCEHIFKIYDLLKAGGHKYGKGYELSVLGTMSTLNVPAELAAEEIMEADDYLKTKKGFGNFTMGSEIRRMYAALMVMDTHMPPADTTHQSLLNSVLTLVIMMEICMMIIITSSITASTVN